MTISFASNKLIEGGDMSATFQSDGINLHGKEGYSIHAIFTGSPMGTVYLAVSNNNEDWAVLADSAQAVSAAGDVFYNVSKANYSYVRFHYSATSGSGSLDAFFKAKGEL
jgi:hypothetical protein